jgi:hypothetical protein
MYEINLAARSMCGKAVAAIHFRSATLTFFSGCGQPAGGVARRILINNR